MERRTINKNVLKTFYKRLPALKIWYSDGTIASTMALIEPWKIPDSVIDDIINKKYDLSEKKKVKKWETWNLNGFAEYYLSFMLRFLRSDPDYFNYERFKIIFENFVNILRQTREIEKLTNSISEADDPYDDNYGSGYEDLREIFKLNLFTADQILEIEKIIEENIDVFLVYGEYNWRYTEQTAPLYIHGKLQEFFPFSEDFIKKYYEKLLVNFLTKNPVVVNDISLQQFVFQNILKANLEQFLGYFSKGKLKHDFTISDELRDEIVLKFNL